MRQRQQLIQNQRDAADEQVARLTDLVGRGLARQEQLLDFTIAADDYRADELEASAFEARARQTAANAEGDIEVERTRYRQDLLDDLLAAREDRALAVAELQTSQAEIRAIGAPTSLMAETVEPVYEIMRGEGDDLKVVPAEPGTPLRPDDVLIVALPLALSAPATESPAEPTAVPSAAPDAGIDAAPDAGGEPEADTGAGPDAEAEIPAAPEEG